MFILIATGNAIFVAISTGAEFRSKICCLATGFFSRDGWTFHLQRHRGWSIPVKKEVSSWGDGPRGNWFL